VSLTGRPEGTTWRLQRTVVYIWADLTATAVSTICFYHGETEIHKYIKMLDTCPVGSSNKLNELPVKATGNSRSGIPGNRGPPKFPAGIPGNF